jgi:hypothetical protein
MFSRLTFLYIFCETLQSSSANSGMLVGLDLEDALVFAAPGVLGPNLTESQGGLQLRGSLDWRIFRMLDSGRPLCRLSGRNQSGETDRVGRALTLVVLFLLTNRSEYTQFVKSNSVAHCILL